ncbi:MAG: PKD domain-containing protein [Bacteroidota bacterium]|nr:PKD domain-containing protein [Bacteroidota bacterium]
MQDLPANKRYYFKYRTLNFYNDTSAWSGIYDFYTFDPLEWAPSLWLAPDDSSVSVDSNNSVLSWLDKSGNNNNLIQSSALAPIFDSVTICTTPSLYFDGSVAPLIGDTIQGIHNSSLTFVGIASGLTVPGIVEQGFFSINNWTNGLWLERGTSTESFVNWSNGDFLRNSFDLPNSGFDFKLLNYRKRINQDVSIYVNEVNTATSTSAALTAAFTNGPFYIGGHSLGNWKGNIGEILLFKNALSDSDLTICNEYLKTKYFPKLNLGEDLYVCTYPQVIRVCNDYYTNYLWSDSNSTDSIVINAPGSYFLTATDILGRIHSDTVIVRSQTTNPPASLFTSDTIKLCAGNTLSLYAGPNEFNYLWSNGETTNKILVDQAGWYAVNINNCIGGSLLDSVYIQQQNLPVFNLGTDTLVCYPNSLILIGDSTMVSWQYLWSTGDNTTSITTNTAGTYWLKVTNPIGCSFNDTISVSFDTSVSNTFLGSDTALCAGNSITLVSGNQAGLSYLWNDNSINDTLIVNASGQYSIIATNSNGCEAKDTINVTISGFAPTASFSNSLTCKNNVVTFTDSSIPPSGDVVTSWNWDFGNTSTLSDTSILQNTFYSYADTGNYVVSLTVETNVGCTQTITKNIHIAPTPIVNFSNVIACQNDSASFINSSTSTGYTPLSYLWDFGDGTAGSSLPNPVHIFSLQNTYPVKLIVTNSAGCIDSLSKNISVKAQVSADFTYSTPCTNSLVTFQDNSIAPAPNNSNVRTWTIGSSTFNGLTTSYPFTTQGSYPVKLTVNGFNGCSSSIIKTIEVKLPPIVQFAINPVCLNDTLKPVDQSTPQNGSLINWNWQLNNTTFSTSETAYTVPSTSGSYSIKLVATNTFGCKDSVSNSVNVFALPVVDFTVNPSSNYYLGFPIIFTPTDLSGTLYNWTIGDTTYTTQNITHSFDTVGTYSATLYMEDTNGCGNTATKSLLVRNRILDLAVLDIRTSYGNDDYITVEADLANYGTVPVSSFEISCHVTNASMIKETWAGTPSSSSYFTYVFTSKIQQLQHDPNYITCVNIESVNSTSDFDLTNNKLCVTSNLSSTSVSDPFPNPTKDNLILPIVLTTESEISFEFIDLLGKIIGKTHLVQGITGLNLISISTMELANGQYFLKILIDDKPFIKKFTKLNQF